MHASFIPPKDADQREPEEQVEVSVLPQHLQGQRCATKPLDIQVPYICIYIYYRNKVLLRLENTTKVLKVKC